MWKEFRNPPVLDQQWDGAVPSSSDAGVHGSNELSVHVGRSVEEKEPSCVTQGCSHPPQRCIAQMCSSEKRVEGELIQAGNSRFSSQKMEGLGWGRKEKHKSRPLTTEGQSSVPLNKNLFISLIFTLILSLLFFHFYETWEPSSPRPQKSRLI